MKMKRKQAMAGRPVPRRRGFLLMEMIVVVLMMVTFTMVLAGLFVVAYRAQVDSVRRDTLLHRVDSVVGTMRRDVWGAREIVFADGHLDLKVGAKKKVRWETSEENRLTRKETEEGEAQFTQTWVELPGVDAVDVHGSLVTLTFKEK